MIAALCLAGLAWLGSDYVMGLMPEREHFGMFPYINTLIGFLCGWIIVGRGPGGASRRPSRMGLPASWRR